MENNKILYILGGVGVLVVLILVFKRGSGSPTVISSGSPASPDLPPNQARLAQQELNTNLFGTLAGLTYGNEALRIQQGTQLAQINAGTTLGLAQVDAAKTIGSAQNTIQSQAIAAARDVGIAQASADTLRAQMYNEALRSQQNAQSRDNLLSGLMSSIGNVLRSIGGQQQSRPSSGGSSGGAGSPSGGNTQPTTRQPTRSRTNPNVPLIGQDLLDPFWNFDPTAGGPTDINFPDFPGGLIDIGEPPGMNPTEGNFYVEDPIATIGDGSPFSWGWYTDPIPIDPGWTPTMPIIDVGEPPSPSGGSESDFYGVNDFLDDFENGYFG